MNMLSQDNKTHSIFVLGMRVDMVQISDVICMMASWISSHSHGYNIVVSNANDALLCKKDSKIKEAVNNSSLSVPDGISLVLLAKLKGYKLKKRVYGPDLMFEFLKLSEIKGYSHFFYGATEETLGLLIKNLKELFPGLKIAGTYSPPFKPLSKEEDAGVVNIINKANPDVLWIGLGCPKQQLWMYEHKDKLRIPVMVGVGAAFDFLAGTKLQAPRWIRDNGFEWLFRLVTEPKRLWRRYLVDCPLFVYYVLLDTISKFLTGIRVRN